MRRLKGVVLLLLCVSLAVSAQEPRPTALPGAGSQPHDGAAVPPPSALPTVEPRNPLAIQVRLDRAGFSPGEIDGALGTNTRRALEAFQQARGLEVTGRVTRAVAQALASSDPQDVLTRYVLTPEDVAGPFVPEIPDDMMARASLPHLGFTSPLEMLAERFHASPRLLQTLNPHATFTSAGEMIAVPHVRPAPAGTNGHAAAEGGAVVVSVSKRLGTLRAVGADGRVLLHAPVTVGSEQDPLPIGEWEVTAIARSPVFYYNPELFWDSDPSHAKAKIPPGPNNPVGTAWIGLTREHYGLHGTPEPALIGRATSHGCVRLTNWDVLRLAALVGRGTRVVFEE